MTFEYNPTITFLEAEENEIIDTYRIFMRYYDKIVDTDYSFLEKSKVGEAIDKITSNLIELLGAIGIDADEIEY